MAVMYNEYTRTNNPSQLNCVQGTPLEINGGIC